MLKLFKRRAADYAVAGFDEIIDPECAKSYGDREIENGAEGELPDPD